MIVVSYNEEAERSKDESCKHYPPWPQSVQQKPVGAATNEGAATAWYEHRSYSEQNNALTLRLDQRIPVYTFTHYKEPSTADQTANGNR